MSIVKYLERKTGHSPVDNKSENYVDAVETMLEKHGEYIIGECDIEDFKEAQGEVDTAEAELYNSMGLMKSLGGKTSFGEECETAMQMTDIVLNNHEYLDQRTT